MGKGTHNKVLRLITDLQRENHRDIDDMTKKWLSQTPNPPRTPEFLFSNENSQTNHNSETNHLGLRWTYRKNFIFRWHIATTNIQSTEVIP